MKTALIIGIDSTIGTFLKNELVAAGWQVYGTTRRVGQVQEQIYYLNLLHTAGFNFEHQVDVVFLCASVTKIASCRDSPELCRVINLDAQVKLAEYFFNRDVHIVFLSTSAVFSGKTPNYTIADETCPITVYGEFKAIAEKKLLNMSNKIAIVRLTKVLTPGYSLFQQWISELKKGSSIKPFYDYYVCPISIKMVTSCLKDIAEKKIQGIVHLSGECDVSYETVAEYLANFIGASPLLIQAKSVMDSEIRAIEAPRYTCLNMIESKKAFNILDTSLLTTLSDNILI